MISQVDQNFIYFMSLPKKWSAQISNTKDILSSFIIQDDQNLDHFWPPRDQNGPPKIAQKVRTYDAKLVAVTQKSLRFFL